MNSILRRCSITVAHLVVAIVPSAAQQYEIIDLGTLGGTYSYASGINDSGVIAGWATTGPGAKHSVLWDGGIVDLEGPGGLVVSEAVAVNESGQVAGTDEGSPQSYEAYRWEDGVWTPLGVLPGQNESIAEDIDSDGRIVGSSLTLGPGPPSDGFIWEDGVMTDLGTLGGSTRAYGINDAGQVVGSSELILPDSTEAFRAFIWQDGVIENLGVLPGEDYSQAFDINDTGDVVGSSWHSAGTQFFSADQATLWRDGGAEIVDLGLTPGPELCIDGFPFYTDNIARAVNNNGQVVGHAQCISSGGSLAAFLWQDGIMYNLNDLVPANSGWQLLSALDINDAGQIVGFGLPPNGGPYDLRAFLLVPLVSSTDETSGTEFGQRSPRMKVFPNPFKLDTHVSYSLPEPGRVRLTVHDSQGRRIATLSDGVQQAGRHSGFWKGHDSKGRSVPNGIYLLRLISHGRIEAVQVIHLN